MNRLALMYCASDPDAWQGEVPPEWEPDACEHPMYRAALSVMPIPVESTATDGTHFYRWNGEILPWEFFYSPWSFRPRWVSDR